MEQKVHDLLDLTGQINREGNYPAAHGGFADVWKGAWATREDTYKVAIKVLRSYTVTEEERMKVDKRLRRELKVWGGLEHENILPLYGLVSGFGPYSSMVCPWLDNGTLNSYLEREAASLSFTDRFQILSEIAAGLSYLHSHGVIHGDLTGSNVLMDTAGKACLSDFGMSTVIAEFHTASYYTSSIGGAIRYSAPELYDLYEDSPLGSVNSCTDIYSFGSVMLQVLSGKVPYYYLRSDALVLFELVKRMNPRPPPQEMATSTHWEFIRRCWTSPPGDRPIIQEVVSTIQSFHFMSLCPLSAVLSSEQIVIPRSREKNLGSGSNGTSVIPRHPSLVVAPMNRHRDVPISEKTIALQRLSSELDNWHRQRDSQDDYRMESEWGKLKPTGRTLHPFSYEFQSLQDPLYS